MVLITLIITKLNGKISLRLCIPVIQKKFDNWSRRISFHLWNEETDSLHLRLNDHSKKWF